MPANLHIANGLRLAEQDLAATKLLLTAANRYTPYHQQQCLEKVLKALLTSEGIDVERKDAHRLDVLVDKLPNDNPFKERIRPLSKLGAYATTFRYPKDGGRMPAMP